MHPRQRGALAVATPGAPARTRTHRRKNSTLEKIVEHANAYIKDITENDPNGADLHNVAFTRHTQRLKQSHGVAAEDELTVLPEAVQLVAPLRLHRPRILTHPEDANITLGRERDICLSVKAQVQLLCRISKSIRSCM
jgi:hypothetical protein